MTPEQEERAAAIREALKPFEGAENTPETRAAMAKAILPFLPPIRASDHIEIKAGGDPSKGLLTVDLTAKTELGAYIIERMRGNPD